MILAGGVPRLARPGRLLRLHSTLLCIVHPSSPASTPRRRHQPLCVSHALGRRPRSSVPNGAPDQRPQAPDLQRHPLEVGRASRVFMGRRRRPHSFGAPPRPTPQNITFRPHCAASLTPRPVVRQLALLRLPESSPSAPRIARPRFDALSPVRFATFKSTIPRPQPPIHGQRGQRDRDSRHQRPRPAL